MKVLNGSWFGRAALSALFMAAPVAALAQTPLGTVFTYQGRLKDGGNPANGLHDLRFRLYDAPAGGSQVGPTVCADNVAVTDGLFTVSLDFGAQFAGQERFLEIDVRADTGLDCANATGFVILAPRPELTGAPNALFSLNADLLDGLDSTAFLQSIPVPLTLSGTSATHIISAANASGDFYSSAIKGETTAASGLVFGGYFTTNSAQGVAVSGLAFANTGTAYGGYFQSNSPAGKGVVGVAGAATGSSFGGYFENVSPAGTGVFGLSTPTNGATIGVSGQSNSQQGRGVFGLTTASLGSGIGVYGESHAFEGRGVFGLATATTGLAHGGWFQTGSNSGNGVVGQATAATGTTFGVVGESFSTSGRGVHGKGAYGVVGQTTSDNLGLGVFGYATATTGLAHGVWGQTACTSGNGVVGQASATTGTTFGVVGESFSTSGTGVRGNSTATTGFTFGGDFICNSVDGRGVRGAANATTGLAVGGRFSSASTGGIGVWSTASAATGTTYGVYGQSNSTSGRGVFGVATAASGTTYGVLGDNGGNGSGWGVYALGHLGASGTKLFRIDHPFDPENKYLQHYCAEGPEPKNAYDGTVQTDARGYAEIALPDYYDQINRDARIQLTVVDEQDSESFVMVKVVQKVKGNGFRIRTSAPNIEVFWRVEAVRNDRWVQKHGAPVEVEKQDLERGTYQHPELYGQPPEMGMNYHAEHERPSLPAVSDATPR